MPSAAAAKWIQNSQNRDGAVIQAKLDELIRVSTARNSFVGIEHLTDEELDDIRKRCELLATAEKIGEKEVRLTGRLAKLAADPIGCQINPLSGPTPYCEYMHR